MPLFEWNDRYLMGIARCDEQHLHLVSLLNKAYDASLGNSAEQDVSWFLNELVDYATYHFISEEKWMHASAYPDIDKHKAAHAAFAEKVTKLYSQYQNGAEILLSDIFSFLHDWLKNHILKTDAEFGRYLQEQNRILSKDDIS